jgi:hypothetical protein
MRKICVYALHCTLSSIIKRHAIGAMPQQTETNSTHEVDEIYNDDVYDDRRQISFRTGVYYKRSFLESSPLVMV